MSLLTVFYRTFLILPFLNVFTVLIFLLLALFPLISAADQAANTTPSYTPVYRIPLRIHLGNSARAPEQWQPILEEINTIWLSQAGICFEIHTVDHDDELKNGLDLWFEAMIQGWNGLYRDLHDMHVRDDPDLRPALHPANSSAARTAAHELGHALNLPHRQDSDDNLMRSKTYGRRLHNNEIEQAREAARKLPFTDSGSKPCAPPGNQQ